jgi:hypothetical protein
VTIERGKDYGEPAVLPADGIVVADDSHAMRVAETNRRAGKPIPTLGLLGGDLGRTLGAPGDAARLSDGRGTRFPVDLGSVLLDGRQHWFVAHVIARRSWWRGRVVAVMNAEWLGRLDVAPRSHPNDGRLDVLDTSLPLRQRWLAYRRLRTGTHVPHPAIDEHRVTAWNTEFDPSLDVWVDGVNMGRVRSLAVRIEPDALTVVV